MGPVPKAGYIDGLGGITPGVNSDTLSGTPFGWFCPLLVSLLAQRNVPLSALLNAGLCECLWSDLTLLLFAKERFGEFPCLTAILHVSFAKIMPFF